jgi:hypothetical protein
MTASKRKTALNLTTDEAMARIFGRKAARQLRKLVEPDKPLKRKRKRVARPK